MPGELSTTGLPAAAVPVEAATVGLTAAVTVATATGTVTGTAVRRGTVLTPSRKLEAGDQFGPRYHVMKTLGVGGMGAVYQAWDEELGMAVALKVIRPEYAARGGEDSERRFKRELVLARQVTHKNVIRIHDLGEVEGTKYISMPFIDGSDLATVIRQRGKLPIAEALTIARQIAAGLGAAHEVGVVHRDLKPANILIGADQQALITDFGIAHSLSGPVEAGVVGTLRYMAPEQARGKPVDHRADIYAVGLIVHEMLTGRRWAGHAAIEALTLTLDQPTGEIPVEARSLEGLSIGQDVPEALAAVLRRCLAFERDERFPSAAALAHELEYIDDDGNALPKPVFYTLPARLPWVGGWQIARGTAIALLALLVAVPITSGAAYYVSLRNAPPAALAPVSLVIADFENRTGDTSLNGVVEQALGIALEGAPFITAMPRPDAQRLVTQITAGASVDLNHARIVAQREGINVVLAGFVATQGSGYTITLNTVDPVPGTVLASYNASAAGRGGLLAAAAELASNLRTALGDTTPESKRAAERETFTAASLEAASAYSQGQALMAAGKWEDAIPHYQKATEIDPGFGRAYSAWAAAAFYAGRIQESEALYKQAFSVIERLTPREKYRVMGNYYLTVTQAYDQAVANYTSLVNEYPADQAGHANLAIAYLYMLDLPKAFEHGKRALDLYPSSLKQRNNYALYAMYSGDFATAAKESQAVLDKDPAYFRAYVPRAIASMDQSLSAVAESYRAMAPLTPQAASLAQMGLADLAMYQGLHSDALRVLTPAIDVDIENGNTAGAAAKYVVMAEALLATGRKADAIDAAKRALTLNRRSSVLLGAGRLLIAAGRYEEARPIEAELAKKLDPHSRVYGRILQAELYMADDRTADAVDSLLAAQKVADMWLVHYLLGQNFIKAQRFPEALQEFDICQRRRGEATAIFLDDVPSIRYLAPLGGWIGKARSGMGLQQQA